MGKNYKYNGFYYDTHSGYSQMLFSFTIVMVSVLGYIHYISVSLVHTCVHADKYSSKFDHNKNN